MEEDPDWGEECRDPDHRPSGDRGEWLARPVEMERARPARRAAPASHERHEGNYSGRGPGQQRGGRKRSGHDSPRGVREKQATGSWGLPVASLTLQTKAARCFSMNASSVIGGRPPIFFDEIVRVGENPVLMIDGDLVEVLEEEVIPGFCSGVRSDFAENVRRRPPVGARVWVGCSGCAP